jgi:hypothetical protein
VQESKPVAGPGLRRRRTRVFRAVSPPKRGLSGQIRHKLLVPVHDDHHSGSPRAGGAHVGEHDRGERACACALPGVVPRRTFLCPVTRARSAPFSPGCLPCCVLRLHVLLAQAPHIVDLYSLNIAPNYIRAAMRRKFDEHRHVSDPRTVDMLLVKGQQEYQETMNQWKMPDQLLGIMLQPQSRPPRTFMQKFLEGACRALCCDAVLICAVQAGTRTPRSRPRLVYSVCPSSAGRIFNAFFHYIHTLRSYAYTLAQYRARPYAYTAADRTYWASRAGFPAYRASVRARPAPASAGRRARGSREPPWPRRPERRSGRSRNNVSGAALGSRTKLWWSNQ